MNNNRTHKSYNNRNNKSINSKTYTNAKISAKQLFIIFGKEFKIKISSPTQLDRLEKLVQAKYTKKQIIEKVTLNQPLINYEKE